MDGTYFKVGLFVIAASVILLVGAGWLGAGAMQKEEYLIETYLNEAVSGLDVGAVVKFRGVPVGSLKEISFVSRYYQTEKSYVLLVLALDAAKVHRETNETMDEAMANAVELGIRARLASGGLTGASYIEVDVHEEDNLTWDPPLEIDWKPEHVYLPSVPSTMTRLTQRVESALKQFTDADLPGLVDDLRNLVKGLDDGLGPTLDNLKKSSESLAGAIAEVEAYIAKDLRPQTRELTGAVTALVKEDLSPAIRNLDEKIGAVAVNLDRLVVDLNSTVNQNLTPALKNINEASNGLPMAISMVNSTLHSLDIFAGSERGRIDESLENIRVLTADLRELVEGLKRDPSRALFGNPPPRIKRGGGKR